MINDLSSFAAMIVRLGRGITPRITAARRPQPERMLELYDFEACPYCRKVREALSELDLDYLDHPVAHGSPRRAELVRLGGKMQAPYLYDPNTETGLYESDDIVAYLNQTYGNGTAAGWRVPLPSFVDNIDSMLPTAMRLGHRGPSPPSTAPARRLPRTRYNTAGTPYCRQLRAA